MRTSTQPENTFRTPRGNRVFLPKVGKTFSPTYTFRRTKGKQSQYFQLGTDRKKAKKLADQIAAYLNQPETTLEDAVTRFNPSKVPRKDEGKIPTIGELIELYEQTTDNRESTKTEAIRALRTVSAFIQGSDRLALKGRTKEIVEQWRNKADSLRIDRITVDKVAAFKTQLLKDAGSDGIRLGKAKTTFHAYRRNAGQLLSDRARKGYGERLILPATNPFLEIEAFREQDHTFRQQVKPMDLIGAAKTDLQGTDPDSFATFVLSLFGGLSRSEMDRLTWAQVDLEGSEIRIEATRYYSPKTENRKKPIPLGPEPVRLLRDYMALQMKRVSQQDGLNPQGEFVLPGAGPSDDLPKIRAKLTFNRLTKWLRKRGITDQKPIHTLWKMAGSAIYESTGSIDKASTFLRNDPSVARKHYVEQPNTEPVRFG